MGVQRFPRATWLARSSFSRKPCLYEYSQKQVRKMLLFNFWLPHACTHIMNTYVQKNPAMNIYPHTYICKPKKVLNCILDLPFPLHSTQCLQFPVSFSSLPGVFINFSDLKDRSSLYRKGSTQHSLFKISNTTDKSKINVIALF